MNRADRRAATKSRPRTRWQDVPLISEPLTVDCLCDGWPCPYCGDITTADDDGIWVCLCGWSGVLVLLPD